MQTLLTEVQVRCKVYKNKNKMTWKTNLRIKVHFNEFCVTIPQNERFVKIFLGYGADIFCPVYINLLFVPAGKMKYPFIKRMEFQARSFSFLRIVFT